jgi:hypothetical protein
MRLQNANFTFRRDDIKAKYVHTSQSDNVEAIPMLLTPTTSVQYGDYNPIITGAQYSKTNTMQLVT